MSENGWIAACPADSIDPEDVVRFDFAERTFAIYRSPDDQYFATDGLCTHQQVHLAGGFCHRQHHRVPEAQWPL
jgi:3-phenylpropionate/trans-cinnamate dioxygenase ferredoxin subunit